MSEVNAVAPQFISTRHRDETAELGMWVFIATEVLLFGGLIAQLPDAHTCGFIFVDSGETKLQQLPLHVVAGRVVGSGKVESRQRVEVEVVGAGF